MKVGLISWAIRIVETNNMAGFNMQVYMNPEPFLILFSSYSRECEPDLSKALAKRTTSRHKFNAWVYLRFRLARTCVHLR